jgi:hypothetical protein
MGYGLVGSHETVDLVDPQAPFMNWSRSFRWLSKSPTVSRSLMRTNSLKDENFDHREALAVPTTVRIGDRSY